MNVIWEIVVKNKAYKVADLAEASRIFILARNACDEGVSRTPPVFVNRNGRRWGHISYNGRVWAGSPRDWAPGTIPAYDPFAEEAPLTAEEIAIDEGIDAEAERSRG